MLIIKIVNEYKNHRKLEHKNIIRVFEIYIDYFTKKIYTIMELAECQEMFAVLQEMGKYNGSFCTLNFIPLEKVASQIFKQILQGINYMHKSGVCHRDLKPNNILVSTGIV
jgi:serine/threonine protein kinase